MQVINGYKLTCELTNDNAGMCRWAFASKGGQEFFIKEFLSPKYPVNTKNLSDTIVNAMRASAEQFYSKRKRFYDELFKCRTGNVVVILDFFRYESSYYIITEKMVGPYLSISDVAAFSAENKRILLKAITYSMISVHDKGIVHSDLKPDNVLLKRTEKGSCTAKLIDFDSGYFAYEVPEEIEGDQVYFSPEAVLINAGRKEVPISVKADVFALGLLFHQYWCGELPYFEREKYNYASDALLDHAELKLNPHIPADIKSLIQRMLSKYQDQRPSTREIWEELSNSTTCPPPPNPLPPEQSPWRKCTDDDL